VRGITVGVAIAIALAVQLDSVQIINRLAIDKDLRSKLVTTGIGIAGGTKATTSRASSKASGTATADSARVGAAVPAGGSAAGAAASEAALPTDNRQLREIALSELVTPQFPFRWGWRFWNFKPHVFPGLVLSAVMLSLGAPFWFNWLKVLLSLRSVLAEKEDDQRKARTEASAPPARAQVAVRVTEGAGEQGDLGLVG
jgi:hypothetical protein